MKTELKNKLKIAAAAAALLVGMVAYKLVYDKRKENEKRKKDEDN